MRIFLVIALWAAPLVAQPTDVIRGRVTGPDSMAVQGVTVRATSYIGRIVKSATTDRNGRYTIIFINGEGDYWLDFVKLGFAPRRFEIKKFGDEEVMIADARLTSTIVSLDAMQVTDQRNRALPNRNANPPDVGGGDRVLTSAGLPPGDAGSLAAMAAGIPGIQLIPGLDGAANMFSFLGLTGDQNNLTFDGLGSGVSVVPPDILASTSIRPYSFDPSVGGFSGAQISIVTMPGSNFSRRTMSTADVAPPLQWADQVAVAQGQEFTSLRLGGNAAGPIAMNTSFYNVAWNVSRRSSDLNSLFNTDPLGLTAAGVSADSAKRLREILNAQQIPTARPPDRPTAQQTHAGQLSLNIDYSPSASGTGHAFTLAALGDLQRSQPAAGRANLLLSAPSNGSQGLRWGANTALVHTKYFWFGVLSKTVMGFAGSSIGTSPYLEMPQGLVQVNSALDDGSSSVRRLAFGGASQASSLSTSAFQVNNQMSWYSGSNAHALKLTTGLKRDGYASDRRLNQLGTFTFNSLEDLENRAPSSFTRTTSSRIERGSQLTAEMSLGDYWRPMENVQVQYGLRAEANRFLNPPDLNPLILSAIGLRNDAVPDRIYLSPRAGMQWFYGESPEISYAPGAARPPRGVIHAGIGVFQNTASAQLIAPAASATGLDVSTRSVTCVGAAIPYPDWSNFATNPASIPTACESNAVSTPFGRAVPSATLFDPGYRQPRSIRGAADWSAPVLDNRFVLGVQAIVSRGLHQQGWIDANFDSTTRFTLAEEKGRPVFVDSSAIVPRTGAISPAGSRRSAEFQRVTLERSDLRLDSRQVSVNLTPVTANRYLRWDLTYARLDMREWYYGFTSTAGNPLETAWDARQQGGKHTVQLDWADFPIFDFMYVSSRLRLSSGPRFTPMTAGDVNGDGLANDRAFVFRPTDAAVGPAIQALLDGATPAVRRCLERQLGELAGRGSCQAPWTANALLQVKFNPVKLGLPKRASVTLSVENPLGIADMALHGDDLRGWGQQIAPDQNLLFITGFDPSTKSFRYDVNSRFGSTRPRESSARALPYVSLGVSFDIGVTRERQILTQRLNIGRGSDGERQNGAQLKQMGMSTIPNPMLLILMEQDSLHLTQKQADSLAWLSRKYAVFADSVWTPAARRLADLPLEYDRGAAWSEFVSARERTVDYLLGIVPHVKGVLTASQRRKLPPQIANYLDERLLRFIRSSTAGDAGSLIRR